MSIEGDAPAAEPVDAVDMLSVWREPYFPFLDDEAADASVSIGDTTHGWLVNARRLAESEACAILPKQRARDLAYGTRELVELVEHAAAELHAHTGRRLWVGNLGRRGGGDIPWSVSHNSGRDVDIALCYLDASGAPVDPPDLVPLDAKGISKSGYRFDVARTWIVVKALLTHPGARVQHLFLSGPLEKQLLAHARKQGEPAAVVQRADDVLHQPGGALPHDDHLHLRLYCSERDVGGGCVNFGPVHAWVDPYDRARDARMELCRARLHASEPVLRQRAIDRLVLLRAEADVDEVARGLDDPSDVVRESAARGLGALGEARHVQALVARFERESELSVKVAVLGALRDLGGAASGELLARVIGTPPATCTEPLDSSASEHLLFTPLALGVSTMPWFGLDAACDDDSARRASEEAAVRLSAIDAAGHGDRLEPVSALLTLLPHPEPQVRARAAGALARITNRTFGEGWDEADRDPATRDEAIASWRRWVGLLHRFHREAWLASAFVAASYRVPSIDKEHAWELVRAVARQDHLAYNAHRALVRVTGHTPPGVAWSDAGACHYWLRWLSLARQRFELEAPPEGTVGACR